MRRRPPRSTRVRSSAASDVYKRQIPVGRPEPIDVVSPLFHENVMNVSPGRDVIGRRVAVGNSRPGNPVTVHLTHGPKQHRVAEIAKLPGPAADLAVMVTACEILQTIEGRVDRSGTVFRYGLPGKLNDAPVSYTHLTLPTILRV